MASVGDDDFLADDVGSGPTLDENVGLEGVKELARGVLIEDQDVIDTSQRSEHSGAVVFGDDWSSGTFEFSHAGIAVDGHDQDVAKLPGLFEQSEVANMEQVEAAVGEDDSASLFAVLGHAWEESFQRGELVTGVSCGEELPQFIECDRRGTGPFDFESGGFVRETDGSFQRQAVAQREAQHGEEHVSRTGDVIDGARVRRDVKGGAVTRGGDAAIAVESQDDVFGIGGGADGLCGAVGGGEVE